MNFKSVKFYFIITFLIFVKVEDVQIISGFIGSKVADIAYVT